MHFKKLGGFFMKLTSSAFEHEQIIPKKFTCQGEDINPSLKIEEVPKDAKSLVLIIDDPDAPTKTWVHWIVFNILPNISEIEENSIPGTQGTNDFNKKDYGGPCPPLGTHRYFFKLYALDNLLNLKEDATKADVENAMQGHILEQATLIGLYSRTAS